jgi:hypothetical protein
MEETMNEQEEFFSTKHKQLLTIATWAKYLAWVVLVIFIFYAVGVYVQEQAKYAYFGGTYSQFEEFLKSNFSFTLSFLIEMVAVLFKGIVYFLILRSVSLGLNMIVETDINRRYNNEQGGV